MKNNKCNDPSEMINELFTDKYLCNDLKDALLLLYNGIKNEEKVPNFMCIADICSTYKKKGSKDDWKNAKGIFFITRFKKVMENLLFNDFYRDIDSRMSESNIGSTAKKAI